MSIVSSYIFLSKETELHTSGKENDNTIGQNKANNNKGSTSITIDINRNLIAYLKKAFPSIIEVETSKDEYDRAFRCQFRITITYKDKCGGMLSVNALIKTHEVKNNFYMSITIQENADDELISGLQIAQTALLRSGIRDDYIVIISYDAISEYYCNQAYSHLNAIERQLRELLFNIYVVNFEKEYYQKTISEEIQNKIKGVMQTGKETERLQQFFYSLEFDDVRKIMFTSHWAPYENEILEKFLKSNNDLSKLSDQELRSTFLLLQPHNDWERLFSDKMNKEEVEELVNSIRKYRNDIAHCKFFSKKNYDAFITATKRLSSILENAIEETERKDFVSKNTESIRHALSSFTKRLDSLFKDIYTPKMVNALKNIADTISKQTIHQSIDLPQTTRQFLDDNDYEEEIDE